MKSFIVRGDGTSVSRDAPWRVRVRGGVEADDGSAEGKSKTPLESIRRAFGGCSASGLKVFGEWAAGIWRAFGGYSASGRRAFDERTEGIRRVGGGHSAGGRATARPYMDEKLHLIKLQSPLDKIAISTR